MGVMELFAIAIAIVVVAILEEAAISCDIEPCFFNEKMMNDKALVHHLSAC